MTLRIVLFGAGSPLSMAAYEAIRESAELASVVVPRGDREADNPLIQRASADGVTVLNYSTDPSFAERMSALHPDLICVAAFAHRLPQSVLVAAARGALNVHTSLLPRHRGADPLFWTYFHDDREAGVTLHWMTEEFDAGDIVAQRAFPIERGMSARDLYMAQATVARDLLRSIIGRTAAGESLPARPQHGDGATRAPAFERATWAIDFDRWPAERVWHFLNGLASLYPKLLPVEYEGGFSFTSEAHGETPGTIRTSGRTIRIYCRDGVVTGRRPSLQRRLRRFVQRLMSTS